jgi:hypothetical protein
MNEFYFPELDEFYDRFCRAVQDSGMEGRFLEKWGLDSLSAAYDMLQNNVQGGYDSHRQTMLAASTGGSVLNIGPGLGFCVFLLSELFDSVLVAEPDGENCVLLERIAGFYRTRQGRCAGDIVEIFHAGLSITPEAVDYWNTKQALLHKRRRTGSILNFTIDGARELKEVLEKKVSRIYLHKVLSSLTISTTCEDVISQCRDFLGSNGEITWSEPEYIFNDILNIDGHREIHTVLESLFGRNNLNVKVQDYQVANGGSRPALEENWTLVKAWRSSDGAK